MQKLSKLTQQEKISALRNAIRHKCGNRITGEQLRRIIDNINIDRPYLIKTTCNCQKFLNMTTEELIATPDRKVISFTTMLYGQNRQGFFYKNGETAVLEHGTLDCRCDAAALKVTVCQSHGEMPGVTYTLVFFLSTVA